MIIISNNLAKECKHSPRECHVCIRFISKKVAIGDKKLLATKNGISKIRRTTALGPEQRICTVHQLYATIAHKLQAFANMTAIVCHWDTARPHKLKAVELYDWKFGYEVFLGFLFTLEVVLSDFNLLRLMSIYFFINSEIVFIPVFLFFFDKRIIKEAE